MTDPVTLAVVRGALEQIADEMDLHLIHAAISPIISETNDCAHGIFHPTTGETIAQGRYGLPVFLANMQFTVTNIIKLVEQEGGFKPGDMWIVNDPYVERHAPAGRRAGVAVLRRWRTVRAARQHRPLDGHRRQRAGRLGAEGDRNPSGGH